MPIINLGARYDWDTKLGNKTLLSLILEGGFNVRNKEAL